MRCTRAHRHARVEPGRARSSPGRQPSAGTWSGWTHPYDYGVPAVRGELLGLYFADAGQHLEHRLFVDHNAAAEPAATWTTRAHCRAGGPTRSGSATC